MKIFWRSDQYSNNTLASWLGNKYNRKYARDVRSGEIVYVRMEANHKGCSYSDIAQNMLEGQKAPQRFFLPQDSYQSINLTAVLTLVTIQITPIISAVIVMTIVVPNAHLNINR